MNLEQESLTFHRRAPHGMLEIVPSKPCLTQHDLSLAYTPGVAGPCRAITQDPAAAYEYTMRGNLVAVITNGTDVMPRFAYELDAAERWHVVHFVRGFGGDRR